MARELHPEPLELVYRYDSVGDQEIAGLIAARLAYGRIAQILASVGRVLDALTLSPTSASRRVRLPGWPTQPSALGIRLV